MRNSIGVCAVFGAACTLLLGSCNLNVFEPFDQPGNDNQYLSAGDACFDQNDFACAQKNYAKLSSNSADEQASREADLDLAQAGAPMEAFIEGFGSKSSSPGHIITLMANYMLSHSTQGPASRAAMLASYTAATQITDNSRLMALGQFQAAFGLLAEIFAEGAGSNTALTQSVLVQNPSACISAPATSCTTTSACDPPSPNAFNTSLCTPFSGTFTPANFVAYADFSNSEPDFCMVDAAFLAVLNAATPLQIGGSNEAGFAATLTQNGEAFLLQGSTYSCYRDFLITEGIGI